MARVPLIQEQDHPELAEVVQKYAAGRRGKLINIYRVLLNAPALAESWFNHSNTIRWKTTSNCSFTSRSASRIPRRLALSSTLEGRCKVTTA